MTGLWAFTNVPFVSYPIMLFTIIFSVSVEKVLPIVYQPQAIFRIRPVNRCSATISGILHINFGHLDVILMVSLLNSTCAVSLVSRSIVK